MKGQSPRKLTRFYIINPIGDRRIEKRFDSRENVVVRFPGSGKVSPGIAFEIGQHGLRLEMVVDFEVGADVEVAFPNSGDNINCFGRIAWARPVEGRPAFEGGMSIDAWHGIVGGSNSWMALKGVQSKRDRRTKGR